MYLLRAMYFFYISGLKGLSFKKRKKEVFVILQGWYVGYVIHDFKDEFTLKFYILCFGWAWISSFWIPEIASPLTSSTTNVTYLKPYSEKQCDKLFLRNVCRSCPGSCSHIVQHKTKPIMSCLRGLGGPGIL